MLAALSLCLPGCKSRPSDEELLKKKLDSIPVHLYLAAKIALNQADSSPEVKRVREEVGGLLAPVRTDALEAELPDPAVRLASPRLGAKDAARIAVALWTLRGLGKEALAANKDDHPAPVLPPLMRAFGAENLAAVIDGETEHGMLMTALLLLKAHEKSPVPVPIETLVYEAWKTVPERVPYRGLRPALHAMKAFAYASNKLCDLAGEEAKGAKPDLDAAAFYPDLAKVTGVAIAQGEAGAAEVQAALAAIGHGATAICYFQRDEVEKARPHINHFVEGAEQMGLESPALSLVRAYLDCADGDASKARQRLEELQKSPGLSADTSDAVAALRQHCGAERGSKLLKAMDRTYFATAVVRVAAEHLERSGVTGKLADSPAVNAVTRFVGGIGEALSSPRDAVPSLKELREKTGL